MGRSSSKRGGNPPVRGGQGIALETEKHFHFFLARAGSDPVRLRCERDFVPEQGELGRVIPCLEFFGQQAVVALADAPVGILAHLLRPVVHGYGEAVKAVVMGECTFLAHDAGHLVEELILESLFRRQGFGAFVIPDHRVPVHDQLVLPHDRLKGVDDAGLLLAAVLHLLDTAGIILLEVGGDEPGEHAITEVGFDDHGIDVLQLRELHDVLEGGVGVAVGVGPEGGEVEEAVEHLDDHHGGLVRASAGGVDSHDSPSVGNP